MRARLMVALLLALLALALGAATPPPVESDPDAASDAAHTQEEIDEAREEFESIDANKDGLLDNPPPECDDNEQVLELRLRAPDLDLYRVDISSNEGEIGEML